MGWNEFVPPHLSISGLVAQLGERSVRIREVEGSNPFGSTIMWRQKDVSCEKPDYIGLFCYQTAIFLCTKTQM